MSQSEFVVTDRMTDKGDEKAEEQVGTEQEFNFISASSFNSSDKIELNIQKGF